MSYVKFLSFVLEMTVAYIVIVKVEKARTTNSSVERRTIDMDVTLMILVITAGTSCQWSTMG